MTTDSHLPTATDGPAHQSSSSCSKTQDGRTECENDPPDPRIAKVPSAWLIPVATALLYAYSYSFEVGYAAAFGYPPSLVSISLDLALNFGTAAFFYAIFVLVFLQLNLQTWPGTRIHTAGLIFVLVLFFASLIACKIWLPDHLQLVYFLVPLTAYAGQLLSYKLLKGEGSSADRLPNAYDHGGRIPAHSVAYALVRRFGFDPLLLALLIAIVLPALFAGAGYAEGRTHADFLLFEESGQNFLILRIGGGSIIAAEYNESETGFRPAFVVRAVEGVGPMQKISTRDLARLDASPP